MSLPPAILPAWGYHLVGDFSRVGNVYLAMTLGFLAASGLAPRILRPHGVAFTLVIGSAVAAVAAVGVSLIPTAYADVWRYVSIGAIGLAAGLLSTATFHSIGSLFRQDPAATVNVSGILFGSGCLTTAVLMAATLDVAGTSVALFTIAVSAAICARVFAGVRLPPDSALRSVRPGTRNFSNPSAVMFGLLLFFHFGNEWSIAGWLAIFLIHRLGVSPVTALTVLAVYWLALLIGRIVAQTMFDHFRHGRLLVGNAAAATVGCTILAMTDNLFGIVLGVLLVGFAFAGIYPLVIERIGQRFPYYQPGLFNGIFSFALVGGMLAPWTLGYFANVFGIQIVMVLPVMGTCAVLLLLVIIWIESRFSSRPLK